MTERNLEFDWQNPRPAPIKEWRGMHNGEIKTIPRLYIFFSSVSLWFITSMLYIFWFLDFFGRHESTMDIRDSYALPFILYTERHTTKSKSDSFLLERSLHDDDDEGNSHWASLLHIERQRIGVAGLLFEFSLSLSRYNIAESDHEHPSSLARQ